MKKLLMVVLLLVAAVLFAEEKKVFGYDVEELSVENTEDGKAVVKWKVPQGEDIEKAEVLLKVSNEEIFKRYKLLGKDINTVVINKLEPLSLVTVKVKLWSKTGEKSLGKEMKTGIRHKNVVFDEVDGKNLLVYLPDGYGKTDEKYPVMYMFDGQNLFSKAYTPAEWQIDEVVDRLVKDGKINKVIVVGMFHAGEKRGEEYIPYLGRINFSDFIVKKIIPYIDGKYQTKANRENRGIMGSSLGGLMTMYMMKNYSDYFSFGGAVSTHDPWKLGQVDTFEKKDIKLWIDAGTAEYAGGPYSYVETARKMTATLEDKGYEYGKNLFYYEVKNAIHNEVDWSERVENPFIVFAGKESDKAIDFTIDWETVCKSGEKSFYAVIVANAKYDNGMTYSLFDKAKYSIDKGSIDKYGKIDFKGEQEAEVTVKYNGMEKKIKISAKDVEERGEKLIR